MTDQQRCPATGKQCLSYALARARARTRRRLHDERVTAYHCRDCSAWHIGHSPPGPRRQRRR